MRGRRHKLQVSTFPFLAVLLCAMGSLILVLLVMDRKAHQAAQARAQREAARLAEDTARSDASRQAERERLQQQARTEWERKRDALHDKLTREQIEMQLQMRKVREQLQQIAARLHYEQDTTTQLRRKTQDERSRLQAEEQLLRTLHVNAKQTESQSKESSQALRRMTLDVLQMEQVLKDLKAARQREQKTFSVVPYHGRRGENRRPLYVECTAEGVIFHPERKTMPVAALIPGSGDPANDVRAEVERRIAQQRQKLAGLPGNGDKTPYLLLLLRPGGVTTYHLFQAALRGLPLDFGYEFIDDDWVLDFPADDELPSTQPWMIASKTSAQPTPAPSAASPPPNPANRPIGMSPYRGGGGLPASGARAFRGGEGGGTGSGVSGTTDATGSTTRGSGGAGGPATAGSAGGNGNRVPGGSGGPGAFSSASISGVPGVPGASGFPGGSSGLGRPGGTGSQNPFANQGNWSGSQASTSSQAGPLANTRGSGYSGNGHGHPSAMPPSFPGSESETGYPGDGNASGNGFRGTGRLVLRGPGSGSGTGYGFAGDGSPGGTSSDLPGLGPPRALSSTSGGGYPSGSPGQGTSAATGLPGNGGPGNSMMGSGSPGSGIPGSGLVGSGSPGLGAPGPAPGTGTFTSGSSLIARGNNGAVSFGASETAMPSAPGSGASPSGTQINIDTNLSVRGSGGSGPGTQINLGSSPGGRPATGGPGTSASGTGGSPSVTQINIDTNPSTSGSGRSGSGPETQINIGGTPGTQPSGGAPAQGGTGRSSDVVIYIDPATGQPTTAPRPAPGAAVSSAERPPNETEDNRGPPRVRVIVGNRGGGDGSAGSDPAVQDRFAPTPSLSPPPRRPAALRPVWVHGGRDWTIYLECRAGDLMLYPSQRTFTLAEATSPVPGNPLIKAIQQMIERRQSSRRAGEPPYHPRLCLLVRPEHVRTFLMVYPALEALPVPKTRRNLDADDDVIGIVTGAVP